MEFWKHLLREGENDGYSFFESESPYPTGYSTNCGRFAPICIWARSIYREAALNYEKSIGFLFPCLDEPPQGRRRGSIGTDFLRAIGLESEIPALETYLKSLKVEL